MPPFPPPPCESLLTPDLIAGACVMAALALIGWLVWEVHRPEPATMHRRRPGMGGGRTPEG